MTAANETVCGGARTKCIAVKAETVNGKLHGRQRLFVIKGVTCETESIVPREIAPVTHQRFRLVPTESHAFTRVIPENQ